jgi:phage tail sheath gpL-like
LFPKKGTFFLTDYQIFSLCSSLLFQTNVTNMGNAVGSDRISKVVGYLLSKGNFTEDSPNLPQRIAIVAEANEANQGTLDLTPWPATSAKAAGDRYGYGSPIYHIMRILKPLYTDGVGGIPIVVYPQAKAGGAAQRVMDVTPTGVATGNGTHTLVISGRRGLDGVPYDINIVTGDTNATISTKIANAVNAVLGTPVIAVAGATKATCTAKWAGLTSNDISITVDTNGNALGITYAVAQVTAGLGTPSVAAALNLFGSEWNTIVINGYGMVASVMTALEGFNGIADPVTPTGRYAGIIMKPFIAITGSVADDPSATTDAKLGEMTIAIAPAPGSAGLPFEAAANMAYLFALISQDSPHLDVCGLSYPDMPVPSGSIGTMADYNNRDAIVKKGCSTVDKVGGKYVVQDFVTTYHPVGETPPQYRYARNLMLDFNVRFRYYILEQINVVGKTIVADGDDVDADDVIKPKQWKQIVGQLGEDLTKAALITNADFTRQSITVNIGSNPDRLDTFFRYKRTGIARISSTVAEPGFNNAN